MKTGKPTPVAGEICPFHKKDVSLVCPKCPLFIELRGVDPNTGQDMDEWGCAFSWVPLLLVENSQQSRQLGAAIEGLRNEQVNVSENMMKAAAIAAQQMKRVE